MRRNSLRWLWLLTALALVAPLAASAAELTDVASSFDKDNPFDFRLRLNYQYTTDSAAIMREYEGAGQDSIRVLKDLVYHHSRHTVSPRMEIGIYHDLALSLELPLIVADNISYEYDRRMGSECIYTGNDANCVDENNSFVTHDNIVPRGGFDAQASGGGGTFPFGADGRPSSQVFRGPGRGGSGANLLDTINLGLAWAPLSQRRDDTKPTWLIGIEYRFSIGDIMKFDRAHPTANTGVADGLDHLYIRTAISHRFQYVDPYVQFWFDYPIVRRGDTLFWDLGPTAGNSSPQISGGTIFGLEGVPYEKDGYKVGIDVNGRISGKFTGRGYSQAWELFASSPALACDAAWNPSCGLSSNPYKGQAFSGLTVIDNYASIGAELALSLQLTKWARFRFYFDYQHDQGHLITNDDVGVPDSVGSRVSKPTEFNPNYRPIIDQIGRRYRVEDVNAFNLGLWGQVMF